MVDFSNAIHGLAGHSAAADVLARIAANYLVFFGVFVLAWLYIRQRSLRTFIAAGLAGVAAVGMAGLMGLVDYVPRPFVAEHFIPLIQHPADSSFPSDHLAALGAVCGATWFAARRLSVATGVVAVVVAFARVYVGVHWVTDVAAGFGLGVITGMTFWYLTAKADPFVTQLDHLLRRWRRPVGTGI
ncbi:MAG TPA: phosphatase PAP2 family protein [Ktedonobacterales bacterium]|nr:phosphatase PAP2 family protein [Ktedonobacterales bacterium]